MKGIGEAIEENEYLFFYMDVVNNRNLQAAEFFNYLNKKYGTNDYISNKINRLSDRISIIKANKLKTIIQYKRAELNNNIEKMQKLKSDFDKIVDVKIDDEQSRSTYKYMVLDKNYEKKSEEVKEKIKIELDEFLDDYLEEKKEFTKEELNNYSVRLSKNISVVDLKKYMDFILKKSNIQPISLKEINQIIEVLNYFVKNIKNNKIQLDICDHIIRLKLDEIEAYNKKIKKLEEELNVESDNKNTKLLIQELKKLKINAEEVLVSYIYRMQSIHIDGEDKLSPSIQSSAKKLLIWKINKTKCYLETYSKALNKLLEFKSIIENNDKESLKKFKISKSNIEENFILEVLKSISESLVVYRKVCDTMVSDSKLEEIKEDFIKKVYKY